MKSKIDAVEELIKKMEEGQVHHLMVGDDLNIIDEVFSALPDDLVPTEPPPVPTDKSESEE